MPGIKILIALALSLTVCDFEPWAGPQWQGWVYPNANDLTDDIPIGMFNSLDLCRSSAMAILFKTDQRRNENSVPMKGDDECGFKCKPISSGLNMCDKTEK